MSPTGQLYGIKSYSLNDTNIQTAYEYNFNTKTWSEFHKELNISDIKFNNVGDYRILDT